MTRKLSTAIPAGTDLGSAIFPSLYDNFVMCKVVDDAATLVSGIAVQKVVKWSQTNNRWEVCNGTVALDATDVVGIVEYVNSSDPTQGQVRVAGVFTDNTLTANTNYYCQVDGSLGTTETVIFIGKCTSAGRLVIASGLSGVSGAVGSALGMTNYVEEGGLKITPESGRNVNIAAGSASISRKIVELATQQELLLDARMVAIVYLKKDGTIGKQNGSFPVADAGTVNRWVFSNWNGVGEIPSTVGTNNLTPQGTIAKVDGWIGYGGKGDGSTGYYVSANSTGFPTSGIRGLVIVFTYNGQSDRSLGWYDNGSSYVGLGIDASANLCWFDNGGSPVSVGYQLTTGQMYYTEMYIDASGNGSVYVNGSLIKTTTGFAVPTASVLYLLKDSTTNYSSCTLHYVEIRNALRTPAQIGAIANKLCLPCRYETAAEIVNSLDIETITPAMRSVNQDEYKITSSTYYTTYYPYNAFDQSTGVTTLNGAIGYLQIKLPFARTVLSYKIKTGSDGTFAPKDWGLKGSINGVDWTLLDSQVNQTAWTAWSERVFSVATPSAYQYYKLDITANNGAGYIDVAELTLTGYKIQYNSIDIRDILPADSISIGMVRTNSTEVIEIDDSSYKYGRREGATGGNRKITPNDIGWVYVTTTNNKTLPNPFGTEKISSYRFVCKKSLQEATEWACNVVYESSSYGTYMTKIQADRFYFSTGATSIAWPADGNITSGYVSLYAEVIE